MRKLKTLLATCIIFIIVNTSFSETYTNLSYSIFPLARFATLIKTEYNNGTGTYDGLIQQEEKYSLPMISFRLGKKYECFSNQYYASIETGISTSLDSAKISWYLPAHSPNFTGETITPYVYDRNVPVPIDFNDTLSEYYDKDISEETKISYLPVSIRFGRKIAINNNIIIPIDFGCGFYLLQANIKRNYHVLVVKANGPNEQVGEESNKTWEYNNFGLSSLMDFNIGSEYKLSEKMVLNINININQSGRISNVIEHDVIDRPGNPHVKEGQEFGGLGYGVGLGVNWSF